MCRSFKCVTVKDSTPLTSANTRAGSQATYLVTERGYIFVLSKQLLYKDSADSIKECSLSIGCLIRFTKPIQNTV